jgi:hypothetical protein
MAGRKHQDDQIPQVRFELPEIQKEGKRAIEIRQNNSKSAGTCCRCRAVASMDDLNKLTLNAAHFMR